jgi:hypothetical protein
MQIAIALVITLISACVLNVGYLLEHSVAVKAPRLSLRHPLASLRSLRSLLGNRRWLLGLAAEGVGWLLYIGALALAPLSLVQAAAAGGIGILALMVARVTHVPLSARERIGAGLSVVGLALLGISLVGSHAEGSATGYLWISVWLAASAVAAAGLLALSRLIGGGPAWGLSAGILAAAGDVSTKMAVSGSAANVAFLASLIVFYAVSTVMLQAGFQRGSALTVAGLATLMTNALPITAGMLVFHEPLPGGWVAAARIVAFAAVLGGAFLLSAQTKSPQPRAFKDEAVLAPSPT